MSDEPTVDEILEEALAIVSDTDREAYLLKSCGHNSGLMAEVQSLIAAARTGSLLDRPLFELGWGMDMMPREFIPRQIGPYRILKMLGEGGMGSVFLAEQTQPVKRLVALKQIRFGRESEDAFLRFRREQQTLAQLEHPNIARVLDAANLSGSGSYLVMEYIDGCSVSHFCRKNAASVPERLKLFLESCLAIQHAHQKTIIHRDIKPNNVMVTQIDGKSVVKVIDFGIAKVVGSPNQEWDITDNLSGTGKSLSPGTPLYMSPEQLVGSPSQLDTRTDIYSLGALLYVLLTDNLPFELPSGSLASYELRRIISELDPVRPSLRVAKSNRSSSGKTVLQSAADLGTVSAVRAQEIQGDLDCIVLKAMSKEPARRYQTVGELMADVQNYLEHKPVTARPASVIYQVSRFAKRHRRLLTALTAAIGCLVVGLIVALVQADRARRSERRMAEQSYASDLLLASLATQEQDPFEVRRKLQRHIPQPGAADRRSFDWHLLSRMNSFKSKTVSQLDSPVYFVCPLKLSQEVASCGADGFIRIHDLETGATRLKIAAGQGEVNGLAVSPNGQLLASAGDDGTIRIWNLGTGEPTGLLKAHQRQAFQVSWSADGQWLATCGNEADVKLWAATDFSPLETLSSEGKDLECLAISARGDVAFGAERGVLTVIRPGFLETNPVDRLKQTGGTHTKGPPGHCSNVAFSPSASLMAAGREDGSITLQSMIEGEPFFTELHFNDRVKSIAFSADGQKLAIGKVDGLVTVIPLESILQKTELRLSNRLTDAEGHPVTLNSSSTHGEPFLVRSVPAMENGVLPSGTNQVLLQFSEPLANTEGRDQYSLHTKPLNANDSVANVAHPTNISVQGNTVTLSFPEATLHSDWEEQARDLTGTTLHVSDDSIASLCFSSDGSMLVVADENGHIQQLSDLMESCISEIASNVVGFAAAENGKLVILNRDFSSRLVQMSASTKESPAGIVFATHTLHNKRFGFSDGGKQLFFMSGDQTDPDAVLVRYQGSSVEPEFVWKPAPEESIRFFWGCFESRWLVLETLPRAQPINEPGAKADIVVMDLKYSQEISRVSGLATVYGDLSPDGRFFVRSTHDGIYFHDLLHGRIVASLPNLKPNANEIAISTDGSKVAIAYSERLLRIYRTSDGVQLQELKLQGGSVQDLAWTPDGRTLVTVSNDGFLRCWSTELLELTMLYRLPTENPIKLTISENGHAAMILDGDGRLYRLQAY